MYRNVTDELSAVCEVILYTSVRDCNVLKQDWENKSEGEN